MRDRLYSFDDADKQKDEFKALLLRHNIKINPKTELEELSLSAKKAKEISKHIISSKSADTRDLVSKLIGIHDLATKLIKAESHIDFKELLSHLEKLNNPLQNIPTCCTDQDNNKMFELYVACLCMNSGMDNILLDNPDNSKGDNPDVIARFKGKNWGFGCKSLHSNTTKTIYDNIVKASNQIENSISECGIAVLNAKNIIDHDKFNFGVMGLDHIYSSQAEIAEKIEMWGGALKNRIIDEIGYNEIQNHFLSLKSEPGCLLYFPTAVLIETCLGPTPSRINALCLIDLGELSVECSEIAKIMNRELQVL